MIAGGGVTLREWNYGTRKLCGRECGITVKERYHRRGMVLLQEVAIVLPRRNVKIPVSCL